MAQTHCRVCDGVFYSAPVLQFTGMPKAAQHLPDIHTLHDDSGVDLEVRQCSDCGLVQLSNEPVPYYKEVIRASAFSEEMREFREIQFSEFVRQEDLRGKKVLEVGTGKGEYLSLMKEAGADVYGIEYAQDSVAICAEAGLKVSRDYIDTPEYYLTDGPFDAFFILNFFEHLPDPNSTLRALHQNLTPDGIGLIEVPNFDMILESNLFTEFIGDHLFYFTKETLRSTLERNGYEVIECKEIWYNYILSATVRKRQMVDVKSFDVHRAKLHHEIHEYIDSYDKVAVWGAGHQSLAVLALLDLGEKIEYVVDSAPFKQGKYTPATHIPIMPPATLKVEPVEAIIIMAASYSDSVARKIRSNFDSHLKVTILRDRGLEDVE
jgi:2-polyprenyl-3-methyl-5-hydroxy-6-metoxy-1,4-benzoquinol methylase